VHGRVPPHLCRAVALRQQSGARGVTGWRSSSSARGEREPDGVSSADAPTYSSTGTRGPWLRADAERWVVIGWVSACGESSRGEQSGKYIDLYGDTMLTRDDFPTLRALLAEAALTASRQPATWQVQVGPQVYPVEKALYRTVVRRDLLDLIAKLEAMMDAAEEIGGFIECMGTRGRRRGGPWP
jgi:hypothetical protein